MTSMLVLDITHLAARRRVWPQTGIDRVDVAFGKALSAMSSAPVIGLHCGLTCPHLVPRETIGGLVLNSENWSHADTADIEDKSYIRAWLRKSLQQNSGPDETDRLPGHSFRPSWRHRLQNYLRWAFAGHRSLAVPPDAIYVNPSPYGTPGPYFFRWLDHRKDVKAVFFIHDLLPLDYPEFFPAKWQHSFHQMVATVLSRADGLLIASEALRARLEVELARFGRKDVPIHVAPLPPPEIFLSEPAVDEQLRSVPFFVACGTIEPRKNHLMLLNLWRRFAEENVRCPALIIVGHRGWEYDHVTALLDRCPALRGRVLEAAGVSDTVQHWLLSNACAALYPSFAEGYGLPIVEALSLGLPTVASNIPVLHEASQGCALFCDPLNAQEWRTAISAVGNRSSPSWEAAAKSAIRYKPPTWSDYFATLLPFLRSL